MSKFDLSKLNKTSQNFLSKGNEQQQIVKKNTVVKKSEKKKAEKLGRPMIMSEPLNNKISANLTESELVKLKSKAGQVPITTFLRDVLKKAGAI
jgi:hypothetical protein